MADTRYLLLRGHTWYVQVFIPRKLQHLFGGQRHLVQSLKTRDLTLAQSKRWRVVAEFHALIDRARQQVGQTDVLNEAIAWREHISKLRAGDLSRIRYDHVRPESLRGFALNDAVRLVEEDAGAVAAQYGQATAEAFTGIATGSATPLLHHVDSWLREGGNRGPLNLRTQGQYRSILAAFAVWCERSHVPPTIEAITPPVVGRYVTEAVATGMNPITHNSHISAGSSYWRWLVKRMGVKANPWERQSRSKASARNGGDKPKRPYTGDELRILLDGPADQEMADMICIGALTGMRLNEQYDLTCGDCRGGIFNIRQAKTAAGVRSVPVHSGLAEIVARRCKGKAATDYLFHEAGPLRPGRERSMAISKRFGRYRKSLGVDDHVEGQRQSRITAHSLRNWFITEARNAGIDVATVSAVVGQKVGNLADDLYSGGPTMDQRRKCVEAVTLPV
jgi:integrase